MRRNVVAAGAALAVGVLAVVVLAVPSRLPRNATPGDRGGSAARAPAPREEEAEQREATEARLEALTEARAAGLFGRPRRIAARPAPGWVGERPVDPRTDDWEPAVAADPNAPYVYVLTTRYGEPKPCPGNCPSPWIALEVSADGGRTWSEGRPLCACKGSGQFDPVIEVVPETGHVYAAFMIGFDVVFMRSTDHGATWSAPVPTWGKVAWNDKPAMAMSPDGRDVYLPWNGPTGGDPWVAVSHDGGDTWAQTKLVDSDRYFFAFDGDVLPDGTVIFSGSSLTYTGPRGAAEGPVLHHAFISRDGGGTWEEQVLAQVELGEPCVAEGCYADFYAGHDAVSADDAGRIVYVYDGAETPGGKQRIYVRISTDGGRTWSAPLPLSPATEMATSPAVEAVRRGDVRLWFMRTNGGDHDAWNVWYRSSSDGGATWSAPVRISDATSGAGYKTPDGFLEVYGDYGEIAVTNQGKTFAVWGEGFSYAGPGGSWFNLQR